MNRIVSLGIVYAVLPCLVAAALPTSASAQALRGAVDKVYGAHVPGEVLVEFRAEARDAATRRYRERYGFETLRRFRTIGAQHLRLPASTSVEEALALLRADPDVVYAEPNHYRSADLVPNDPHFGLLWGLRNTGQPVDGTAGTPDADIDADEAWELTTGGGGVIVAVIDTGLDFAHPDLAPNVWTNPGEVPGNGVDDDGNGYVDDVHGWDFVEDDNAPYPNDANGHGTHVAGTIAAVGNDGTGVAGVAWGARIMALRYLDAYGFGPTSDAILAIEYASAMGARVINNSWGGGGFNQALVDAVDASPAVVVCSAGNSAVDTDAVPSYPGSYPSPNIVAVAATDPNDGLATFSNYGATSVDVGAPGVNIYSAVPGRLTVWADDFDDGSLDGWTLGGKSNEWDATTEYASSGSHSLTDSPDGDYATRTNAWCRAPELDLSGQRLTKLVFQVRGVSEPGYDLLYVEASPNGVDWVALPIRVSGIGLLYAISGFIPDWREAEVDLTALDGNDSAYVRFTLISDWSNNYDGWYIDDVAVTAASDVYDGSEYRFLNGTSMAAPHVSGVAALVAGLHPAWTAGQIKQALLDTVDPLPSLAGKTVTGGRLNAAAAVQVQSTPGSLQFGTAAIQAAEGSGTALLTVTRTGGGDGPVGVSYASGGGTATAGNDYTAVAGTLSWANGETEPKTIAVPILDDAAVEGDETVVVTLASPTGGATLGAVPETTVTIVDDDVPSPGTLRFTAAALSVDEGAGQAVTLVERVDGSDGAVGVTCASGGGTATAGEDYEAVSAILTWPDGDVTPRPCSVPVVDDPAMEEDETLGLALSNPVGGARLGAPSTAVVTIVDDDVRFPGELEFTAAAFSVAEDGGAATVTVSRSGGSDGAVGATYATGGGTAAPGTDYTAVSGTLTWADGETAAKTFTVPIVFDALTEGDETVLLTLTDPTNGAKLGEFATATLTIIDVPVNHAPVLAAIGSQTPDEGQSLAIELAASDQDGDGLAFQVAGAPEDASLTDRGDGTAVFSWTPKIGDRGTYRLTFTVIDDGTPPLADSETVTVTVGVPTLTVAVPVTAGWNLISFPVGSCRYLAGTTPPAVGELPTGSAPCQAVTALEDAFPGVSHALLQVRAFGVEGARNYDPALPAHLNDLSWVAGGYGYWVKLGEDLPTGTTVSFIGPALAPAATLAVREGWNLVGYWGWEIRYTAEAPPTVPFPDASSYRSVTGVEQMFPGVAASLAAARSYDSTGEHTDPLTAGTQLEYAGPGYGYWLKVGSEGTLDYALP
jgi:subtilisin family serine protease